MNPALAALQDIHLPPALPWWNDIAMVWWLLLVLIGILIAVVLYQLPHIKAKYQQKQQRQHMNHAILEELQHIKVDFQQTQHYAQLLSQLSIYLRRVALAAFPQQPIAGLLGEEWLQFLDAQWKETKPQPSFLDPEIAILLQKTVYQSSFDDKTEQNIMKLLHLSEKWAHEVSNHHV
ncbi:MAG: DUF4381 domain-containing protein [Ghiorsea sp.]